MVGAILGNKNFGDQAAQLSNGINQTYCSPIFVLVNTTESHYLSKNCHFVYLFMIQTEGREMEMTGVRVVKQQSQWWCP